MRERAGGEEKEFVDAREWITRLGLQPHPEGGFFRETYREPETIAQEHLPPRFSGDRAFSTAIYFLLEGRDFSALHRIRQDEMWHFYDGCPLLVSSISPEGTTLRRAVGTRRAGGRSAAGGRSRRLTFSARRRAIRIRIRWLGCTVAPGFDFADFELPTRAELAARFPQHAARSKN